MDPFLYWHLVVQINIPITNFLGWAQLQWIGKYAIEGHFYQIKALCGHYWYKEPREGAHAKFLGRLLAANLLMFHQHFIIPNISFVRVEHKLSQMA